MTKSTKFKKAQKRKVEAYIRMEKRKAKKVKCTAMKACGFEDSYTNLSYEDLSSLLGLPTRIRGSLD